VLLIAAMALGALSLWLVVPAVVLWSPSRLVGDPTEHLVLGLLAVPLGMVLFGLLLAALNGAYLRLAGAGRPLDEPNEEEGWRPRLRGPLDRMLEVSAVLALLALLCWMLFAATVTGSVAPW
jgi:hypothetical protein